MGWVPQDWAAIQRKLKKNNLVYNRLVVVGAGVSKFSVCKERYIYQAETGAMINTSIAKLGSRPRPGHLQRFSRKYLTQFLLSDIMFQCMLETNLVQMNILITPVGEMLVDVFHH